MGEFFALLTAALWAGAVICFKLSGEHLPPLVLNLFRVAVSSVLLLATMFVVGQPPWRAAEGWHYLLIGASGLIAIAISDTLFHASLNRIGAGLSAIVDSLYPPLTALFAYAILAERLTTGDLTGMVLVVAAVLLTTQARLPVGTTRAQLMIGLVLGALAMATLGLGVVIVKPVLAEQPVIWVTGMRQFAALAVLGPSVALSRDGARWRELLRLPRRAFLLALAGTVLGSFLALMFWIGGMKFTAAGTAAILNQTAIIYILILATWFLREPFTVRKLIACALAVGGVVAVVVN